MEPIRPQLVRGFHLNRQLSKSIQVRYCCASLLNGYLRVARGRGIILETIQIYRAAPNVVVEWLIFLLRIREFPGSNLGSETGYPD
jgi:hypothetical protein